MRTHRPSLTIEEKAVRAMHASISALGQPTTMPLMAINGNSMSATTQDLETAQSRFDRGKLI